LHYLFSKGKITASDIVKDLKLSKSTVWDELNNLESAGVISSEYIKNSKEFSVRHVKNNPLKQLIEMDTFQNLKEIGTIKGVDFVIMFGSFTQKPDSKSDIDLLVIGHPDLDELDKGVMMVENYIKRDVDYFVFTQNELKTKKSQFIKNALKKYRLVCGDENELSRIIKERDDKKG
jgi:predicted nucleotidyltransferase